MLNFMYAMKTQRIYGNTFSQIRNLSNSFLYCIEFIIKKYNIQKIRYNERQSVLDNDLLQTKKVANIIHIQELVAIRFILTSPLRIEPSKLVKEIHKYDLSFSCFAVMEF